MLITEPLTIESYLDNKKEAICEGTKITKITGISVWTFHTGFLWEAWVKEYGTVGTGLSREKALKDAEDILRITGVIL